MKSLSFNCLSVDYKKMMDGKHMGVNNVFDGPSPNVSMEPLASLNGLISQVTYVGLDFGLHP